MLIINEKYLFFSSKVSFVILVMKFSDSPIFSNISGKYSVEELIENFLELTEYFFRS